MKTKTVNQLKTYLTYLRYILQHKWYVFIECVKTGQPWHGITHDLSKFLPSEFFPYAEKFFSGDYAYKYFEVIDNFNIAWLYHQKRNKHHWNYWVDSCGRALPMPRKYVMQMLADWRAMGRQHGDTAAEFYEKNLEKIKLHPITRETVERILKVMKAIKK